MKKDMVNYSKIKLALLEDENIERVIIDDIHEKILITPRQDLHYDWIEDPLINFKTNGNIKIHNRTFKVISYLQNMNKVYELVLKEY